MTHAHIIDFRLERLVRKAPLMPLDLCQDDISYVEGYLAAIGESFGRDVSPPLSLTCLPARAFARHLAALKADLDPEDLDQRLALGRMESIIRLVESTVSVMQRRARLHA